MKFGIGQSVPRLEDPRLLRGEGRYVDDITLENQCHAAVLRSDVAHGTLIRVDLEAARQAPGVLLVWAHADIVGRLTPLACEFPMVPPPAPAVLPHLAHDKVRFVGQPLAFAVAETRAQALDALELVEVVIDELPAVTDPVAALAEGAPQLHSAAPGNLAYTWEHGDAAACNALFAEAAHVVSTSVLNQRVAVASIEPRGIVVRHADERWEVWTSSQGAHGMRAKIANSLGVAPERVRVHVGDVGGGFGMKLMDHPEYGLCALACADLARPVKWVGERTESFLSDAQGRDVRGEVEGAFDGEGVCTAMRMRTISGLGAYYSTSGAAIHTVFSANLLGGMYKIRTHHARVQGAFINATPMDAYRGAGRPETIYMTERLMDAAARQLGIDRVEIRRRNLVTPEMVPHPTPGGFTIDSLDTLKVIDDVAARHDWEGFAARRDGESDGRVRGVGVAYYMERTGGQPLERARVELTRDGGARVFIGTQSTGQGHETAWAQMLHTQLGLPVDRIRVESGDSDALEIGSGTRGARSAKMAGRVLSLAAEDILRKGLKLAAERLEAAEADIEFSPETAAFSIAGTDRRIDLAALVAEADITGFGAVDDAVATFPNGCHIAEVALDPETGRIALERYTVTDEFGTLINPALVVGQVHGGVVQGLGQIMGEGMVWDDSGQPKTVNFMEYAIPRANDVPAFDVGFIEAPAQTNPLGVKGCGEAGCAGGIAAAGVAVLDALAQVGVNELEAPYTPFRVWRAIREASNK